MHSQSDSCRCLARHQSLDHSSPELTLSLFWLCPGALHHSTSSCTPHPAATRITDALWQLSASPSSPTSTTPAQTATRNPTPFPPLSMLRTLPYTLHHTKTLPFIVTFHLPAIPTPVVMAMVLPQILSTSNNSNRRKSTPPVPSQVTALTAMTTI